MDANVEYFEKYIVKKIVSTVDYNPETDEYEMNRVHISDDIIKVIENEGSRYGLQREEIHQLISRVAANVKPVPSSRILYNSINVGELKVGSHLRINMIHPVKGGRFVEMIVLEKQRFFVLGTDISGLSYGDELLSVDKTWNMTFYIDFVVSRNAVRIPDNHSVLRLGKLESVELFEPSVVHEILDSKSSYTFDSYCPSKEEHAGKRVERLFYFWMPNRWNPISFCWKEGFEQNENSTFVIKESADSEEAIISLNQNFNIFQVEELNYFMEILFDCCKWKNAFLGTANLKGVKPVRPGKVIRKKSEPYIKEWELVNPPKIKFIYADE